MVVVIAAIQNVSGVASTQDSHRLVSQISKGYDAERLLMD